jgi:quercetin dioxygenase-like cupin family protein
MKSRRKFIEQSGLGMLSLIAFPLKAISKNNADFEGLVVNDQDGEAVLMRDGTSVVRIKISKNQGANTICFLSESFRPGDALPVHKHLNEDELIFIHKGAGLLTLGEKVHEVTEGAVALVPRGVWHGLQNTGTVNIEMRMAFTPSGFEGFFREVGTPVGQTFIKKTMEERRAIAKKWGMIYKA